LTSFHCVIFKKIRHIGEEYDAYSTLFGFSRVKNIWAKVVLRRVKNIGVSKQKLHPPFPVYFAKNPRFLIYFPLKLIAERFTDKMSFRIMPRVTLEMLLSGQEANENAEMIKRLAYLAIRC